MCLKLIFSFFQTLPRSNGRSRRYGTAETILDGGSSSRLSGSGERLSSSSRRSLSSGTRQGSYKDSGGASRSSCYKDSVNTSRTSCYKDSPAPSRSSFGKDSAPGTPSTSTPVTYRKSSTSGIPTANHRSRAAARYQVAEYNFEREQPDSPFSDDKDSDEKKKSKCMFIFQVYL